MNHKIPSAKGQIKIVAEELTNNSNTEICTFNPEAQLSEHSGKYFFIILKNRAPNQYVPVYKSEVRTAGNDKIVKWN
jgi:hypothetical protein